MPLPPQFASYLEDAFDNALYNILSQVSHLYDIATIISPDPIETIFVSEHPGNITEREVVSLECFSSSTLLSLSLVNRESPATRESEWTIIPIRGCVAGISAKAHTFGYKRAMPASKLTIEVSLPHNSPHVLSANRENCTFLQAIMAKYLLPNLIGYEPAAPPATDGA